MTNRAIKIVRPWPAEQPRPPQIHRTAAHRTDRTKASTPEPANTPRSGIKPAAA
jgi:hypothetical protein